MAARCQISISLELATGNWQPDANSILEDFIHFQVNSFPRPPPPPPPPFNGSQMRVHTFLWIANWQPHAN